MRSGQAIIPNQGPAARAWRAGLRLVTRSTCAFPVFFFFCSSAWLRLSICLSPFSHPRSFSLFLFSSPFLHFICLTSSPLPYLFSVPPLSLSVCLSAYLVSPFFVDEVKQKCVCSVCSDSKHSPLQSNGAAACICLEASSQPFLHCGLCTAISLYITINPIRLA